MWGQAGSEGTLRAEDAGRKVAGREAGKGGSGCLRKTIRQTEELTVVGGL